MKKIRYRVRFPFVVLLTSSTFKVKADDVSLMLPSFNDAVKIDKITEKSFRIDSMSQPCTSNKEHLPQ